MKKLLAIAALTLLTATAVSADANAWERHRTVTGGRGTAQLDVTGSCGNGACNRSVTRTGPYGGTMTHQGNVSCDPATQHCTAAATTTGPYGGTVTRQTDVSR